MADILLSNVCVDYPVFCSSRSFRTTFIQMTGGLIHRVPHRRDVVTVRALDGVTLHLKRGDRVALIGGNGAGKSTLLKVCAGVFEPSAGSIRIGGRVSPLLGAIAGMDLDDTGYENIYNCGLYLGMSPDQIEAKIPEIAEFTELGDYLALPVRSYSTGMLVRLSFAISTSVDPEILVMDEGLGAVDAAFAGKARTRVDALVERSSVVLLASHSENLIRSMCNRGVLLRAGRVAVDGGLDEVFHAYASASAPATA